MSIALRASMMSLRMPRVLGIVRVFADPDAVVDAAAQVLGEVAVEVAADGAAVLVAVDDGLGFERIGGRGGVRKYAPSAPSDSGERWRIAREFGRHSSRSPPGKRGTGERVAAGAAAY